MRPMSIEEEVRLLSTVDILEPLSEEELEKLARRCSDAHLERGEIFYTPHDRSERLFILKKGKVRIFRGAPDGREFTLAMVDAGTVFGEMALTAQRLEGAYAQAVEASILLIMSREDLEHLILEARGGPADYASLERATQALRDPPRGHLPKGRTLSPG